MAVALPWIATHDSRLTSALAAFALAALLTLASAGHGADPAAPPLITAVGIGRPSAESVSAAQARLMAERAALLVALRDAARRSGRAMPPDYQGTVRVGAVIREFRVTRVTPRPDGSVEVEVMVPAAGVQ
jgi:hypothetical protein